MLKRNVADNILSSGHGGADESRLSGRVKKREKEEEMIDFPSE